MRAWRPIMRAQRPITLCLSLRSPRVRVLTRPTLTSVGRATVGRPDCCTPVPTPWTTRPVRWTPQQAHRSGNRGLASCRAVPSQPFLRRAKRVLWWESRQAPLNERILRKRLCLLVRPGCRAIKTQNARCVIYMWYVKRLQRAIHTYMT